MPRRNAGSAWCCGLVDASMKQVKEVGCGMSDSNESRDVASHELLLASGFGSIQPALVIQCGTLT